MIPVSAHPAKVVTPLMAADGSVVQVKVPPDAVKVIDATELEATLPLASSTVTAGWVVRTAPLVAPSGCVENASLAPAPGARVNALVAAWASPPFETDRV